MSNLQDRLDQDVEGWRPEPGDKVFGTLITVTTREGDYGQYPYLEVEQDDGSLVGVHAFHTVLKNEIAQQRPRVGDEWGAKYHGKVQGKRTDSKGKVVEFEKYTTVHASKIGVTPPAPDWSAMEESSTAEAAEQGITNTFPGATEEDTF